MERVNFPSFSTSRPPHIFTQRSTCPPTPFSTDNERIPAPTHPPPTHSTQEAAAAASRDPKPSSSSTKQLSSSSSSSSSSSAPTHRSSIHHPLESTAQWSSHPPTQKPRALPPRPLPAPPAPPKRRRTTTLPSNPLPWHRTRRARASHPLLPACPCRALSVLSSAKAASQLSPSCICRKLRRVRLQL